MSRPRHFAAPALLLVVLGACLHSGEAPSEALPPEAVEPVVTTDAEERPQSDAIIDMPTETRVTANEVAPTTTRTEIVTRDETVASGVLSEDIAYAPEPEPLADAGESGGRRARPAPTSRPAPAPRSTESDDVLSQDFLNRLPSGRSYQTAVSLAAGVGPGEGNPSVAGASYNEPSAQPVPPPQDLGRIVRADDGEGYTDYGVNGFTDPRTDNLSTFSIDVDTASYTVTRRKLREGYLPPTAAVRAEEFVNYLPYEYTQPDAGSPFAVDFEAAPSPFNPRNHIVRVGVQGRTVEASERKPVHLTFLVDVSGSMRSSDKLGLLKRSLSMLTRELDDGDSVAIATYAGNTRIVLPPTPIRDAEVIVSALEGLTAGGSTAMGSGIELAYELADRSFVPGHVNRVIVASDGDANVGRTSHTQLSEQIRGYAERGITLTTLGFGSGNYQDTMMERLANDGDGNYYYLDGEAEARRVLVDRLSGTLEVIAKDVKLQVEWDPSQVLAYRLIGYENRDIADRDFRNDAVDAGEIGAGHQVTALYEVALADNARGQIATVRVRSKAPGPDAPAAERTYAFEAKAIGSRFTAASPQFQMATAAGGFAEVLRGSPHMAETSMQAIHAIAAGAQRAEYSEDAELVGLIDLACKLRGDGALVMR